MAEDFVCIYCQKDQMDVPLISFLYKGKTFYICPQHLPILIHQPALLADRLPGLEKLNPAEHDPH